MPANVPPKQEVQTTTGKSHSAFSNLLSETAHHHFIRARCQVAHTQGEGSWALPLDSGAPENLGTHFNKPRHISSGMWPTQSGSRGQHLTIGGGPPCTSWVTCSDSQTHKLYTLCTCSLPSRLFPPSPSQAPQPVTELPWVFLRNHATKLGARSRGLQTHQRSLRQYIYVFALVP